MRPVTAGRFPDPGAAPLDGVFAAIIRACKAAGLPIAGADRLRLGGELAVKDLLALLAFLATPEDDLSLAAALRSPLFGWSEAAALPPGPAAQGLSLGRRCGMARAAGPDTGRCAATTCATRRLPAPLRPARTRILTRHDGRRACSRGWGPRPRTASTRCWRRRWPMNGAVPVLTGFLGWIEPTMR
jgi:ATP-dependent helicase/nuclease subunit A